jgi:hypothetical protein
MGDLIDYWNEPKDLLEISELFEFLRVSIVPYFSEISDNLLNTKGIIRIVKDLRELVNPKKDGDIYFFTDRVCDRILLNHEGEDNISNLMDYIADCEERACLKH